MVGSITDVAGIEVGHAEDRQVWTGCTVILSRPSAVVGAAVRGSAPGTRETDLCRPGTLVERADAVLLTGGSAFGLESATGVVRWLWEREIGFDTGQVRVPIVPGAVIFDLGIGQVAWPDAAMGYRACAAAGKGPVSQGCVGAGTGASIGKVMGMAHATKSGLGTASVQIAGLTVGALVVVNAFGSVIAPDGKVIAGPRDPSTNRYVDTEAALVHSADAIVGNTTLAVVATDAPLRDTQTQYLAEIAHDGLARSIRPVHTMVDGDTVFTLATGMLQREIGTGDLMRLHAMTIEVVGQAVRNAIIFATSGGGLPGPHGSEA